MLLVRLGYLKYLRIIVYDILCVIYMIHVVQAYEGILDFNQVEHTFTPITYEMISYHL